MEANNLLLKYLKQIPKYPNLPPPPAGSSGVKVKQEKRDDPPPKPFPPPPPPPDAAKAVVPPVPKAPTPDNSPPPIDFSSIQGRFGWMAIEKDHLPFIIRGEARYFAVRMVESEIISKYTKILPYDAFTYTNIKSYYITENEAKLLNEINLFHCNGHYSMIPFTVKDVVVSVEDTQKFYDYLEFCKNRYEVGSFKIKGEMTERCGLLQINKLFLMPYLTKDRACYVLHNMLPPSVYCDASDQVLDDWDLAYMKFVCWVVDVPLQKVQKTDKLCLVASLKNFDNNSTVVQELTVTKQVRDAYMNPALQQNYHYHQSLKENYSRNMLNPNYGLASGNMKMECKNGCGCMGPCSHLVDMRGNSIMSSSVLNGQLRAVPASGYWNSNSYGSSVALVDPTHKVNDSYRNLRLSLNVPTSDYLKPNDTNYNSHSSNYNPPKSTARSELDSLFPPPPPLVRVDSAHSNSMTPASTTATCDGGSLRPPPPLQPAAQYKSSSNPVIVDVLSLVSKDAVTRTEEIRQSASRSPEDSLRRNSVIPPHHYPTPPQSSPLQASVTPTPIGISMSVAGETPTILPGGAVIDLCSPPPSPDNRIRPVSDSSYHQMAVPHVLQSVQMDGKHLPCINLEPFKHKSMLVTTVSALVKTFFPSVSVQSCQFALKNVLGVQLHPYIGMHQVSLASLGFLLAENDPLLSVSDAKLYLPHLAYMFQQTVSNDQSSNDLIMESPAPKRLCTSSSSDN